MRKFPPSGRFRCLSRGFSILELLVAVAVLALLMVLILQMISGAVGTTSISRKRVSADNEARRIFDRISGDISGMLDRADADFLIRKSDGNDAIYFFAAAPARAGAGSSPQPVSLVGYRINDLQQIERLAQGLEWDAAPPDGAVFLTFSGSTPDADSTIAGAYSSVLGDADKFHVLGEGVFRMEISFLLKPDSSQPAKLSTSPFRSGGASPFSNKGKGFSDVQAIVVTLVILDEGSRILADDLSGLAGKFGDAVDGTPPADAWQTVVLDPAALGIPAAAASHLRIYQRVFPLNKLSQP